MSKSLVLACACIFLSLPVLAARPQGPLGIGRAASEHEIVAWDIDVGPDGAGLPPGSGDAATGAVLFATHCASCHGPDGRQGPNALAGPDGPGHTVGNYWPWATTLFDYIRRAMPPQSPGALGDGDVYSLTAHILALNGLLDRDAVLDATALAAVRMPARERFVPDDRRGGAEVR